MALHRLPTSTVKLLGSSQVITSVASAVKELIENSLDAGATNIDVKLENHGLDKIEVKDNGHGIPAPDVGVMCQKSFTSKIKDFQDLESLQSYGFRGEALNSLCAVSQVTVTTKTETDKIAMCYKMDSDGQVLSSTPSHINQGTIIVIEGLFKNLPVRRQFLSNGKRKNEEIKKVEGVIKSLAIIHPKLRLTFCHNKFVIWQKYKVLKLMESVIQAVPPTVVRQLTSIKYSDPAAKIEMEILLPKRDCNIPTTCYSSSQDATYLYVNARPIRNKILEKAVQNELFQYFGLYIPNNKFPFCLVSLNVSPDAVDVNLEPNKTKVLLKNMDVISELLKKEFLQYYEGKTEICEDKTLPDLIIPKRKFEEFPNEEEIKNKILKKETSPLQEKRTCKKEYRSASSIEFEGKIISTENCNEADTSKISISQKDEFFCGEEVSAAQKTNEPITDLNSVESISYDVSICINEPTADSEDAAKQAESVCLTPTRADNISAYLEGLLSSEPSTPEAPLQHSPKQTDKTSVSDFDIENITLSQWSKGHVFDNENKLVEGGIKIAKLDDMPEDATDLMYESVFPSASSSNVSKDPVQIINESLIEEAPTSGNDGVEERSVSSQMGAKDMAGFTKFAVAMRPKIIQENPGIPFTKVAEELAVLWKNLSSEERQKYEELAKKCKDKNVPKKNSLSQEKFSPLPVVRSEKGKVAKKVKKRDYHKIIEVETSFEDIKKGIAVRNTIVAPRKSHLIGKITENLRCFTADEEINVISLERMMETFFFYKRMATMDIPIKVLESNIKIIPNDIGEKHWILLKELKRKSDPKDNSIIISSECITKNGFRIEVIQDQEDLSFEITDVPVNISFYGVEDLKEILSALEIKGSQCDLADCRPLKAAAYIRSETIRMLAISQQECQEKDLQSYFNFWSKTLNKKFTNCPHHKPVVKTLVPA